MATTERAGAAGAPLHPAVVRPAGGDLALIGVAIVAISTSGPLMASAALAGVPTLAIAFWRNGLSGGLLTGFAVLRRRPELRALDRREWRLSGIAGACLALHFALWVPSLALTTVASATAMGATQPIWQALIARLQGHDVPRRAWAGIAVAVIGAVWLSGVDLTVSPRNLLGDAMAFGGGAGAAMYVAAGAEVRRSVSTTTYTAVCYSIAALSLAAVCLLSGQRLHGYPPSAWVKLLAITAGAQLLGHSIFNVVLRTTSPTIVALAILLEVPGAALIAAVWLHQVPRLMALPAAVLLVVGIATVVTSGGRREPTLPTE